MIFLSEFIEWIACLTEVGLFYWLAGKTFREERKNVRIYWDYILSVILAVMILGLNNIVLYSSFTLFFWMLFGSVSAMALYRVSYIKLLSLTVLYTLCFCSTDMLASNLYLSVGNHFNINGDTIMTFSLQRIGLVVWAKSVMIVFVVSLRKLIIPLIRSEHEKRVLLISLIAFLLFLYYRKPAQSSFSVEISIIFGLLVWRAQERRLSGFGKLFCRYAPKILRGFSSPSHRERISEARACKPPFWDGTTAPSHPST